MYCPSLYHTEKYSPEICDEFGKVKNSFLEIVRIRHFFEFDDSLILKRTEEITFFNKSNIALSRVVYNVREFLPHLCIYDSNGEILIFHGIFEIKNQSLIIKDSDEGNSEHAIVIEFPKTRQIDPNSFRIITLKYTDDIGLCEGDIGFINLPIGLAPHFYLYIKKLNEYITEIHPFVEEFGGEENVYFEIDELEKSDYVQIQDTPSYFSISSSIAIPDCNLIIATSYQLPNWNLFWFNGGIIIGIGAILTNFILIKSDVKSFLSSIVALGAITNTYLILTRGWLFTKAPVERILKTPYTSIYFWIILCIFLEIFFACILAFFVTGYNQNIDIASIYQITSNFTICRGWVI